MTDNAQPRSQRAILRDIRAYGAAAKRAAKAKDWPAHNDANAKLEAAMAEMEEAIDKVMERRAATSPNEEDQ